MSKPKAPAAGAKKALPPSRAQTECECECECECEPIDLNKLREVAEIAAEFDLAEIELDACGGLRVVRRAAGVPVPTAAPLPAAPPAPLAASAEKAAAKPAETGALLTSPFVGTFYRAPAPEAPPFVDVGQTVRKGQVVCIVEAMKLMNEIESEFDGKVLEILVKNAEHVEYGQPLFRIEKA
jgi:acetyl-CoA carboxylase biotin carboxyl carrier protein